MIYRYEETGRCSYYFTLSSVASHQVCSTQTECEIPLWKRWVVATGHIHASHSSICWKKYVAENHLSAQLLPCFCHACCGPAGAWASPLFYIEFPHAPTVWVSCLLKSQLDCSKNFLPTASAFKTNVLIVLRLLVGVVSLNEVGLIWFCKCSKTFN